MTAAYIDPDSADYVAAAGDLQRDPADGLANAVYLRVMTPLGTWWADATLGSRLHELAREKDVPRVERLARMYLQQALQPLLDDGRVRTLELSAEREPSRLNVRVELVDAQQQTRTFDMHVKVG